MHHQGMCVNGGRNRHFGPPPTQGGVRDTPPDHTQLPAARRQAGSASWMEPTHNHSPEQHPAKSPGRVSRLPPAGDRNNNTKAGARVPR